MALLCICIYWKSCDCLPKKIHKINLIWCYLTSRDHFHHNARKIKMLRFKIIIRISHHDCRQHSQSLDNTLCTLWCCTCCLPPAVDTGNHCQQRCTYQGTSVLHWVYQWSPGNSFYKWISWYQDTEEWRIWIEILIQQIQYWVSPVYHCYSLIVSRTVQTHWPTPETKQDKKQDKIESTWSCWHSVTNWWSSTAWLGVKYWSIFFWTRSSLVVVGKSPWANVLGNHNARKK